MTLSQIGRYTIIDEIGSGGFATVYRAMDRVLQREVALKVIRPWLMSDSDYVARFQREARIVAQLDHPRIVSILDFGEHDGRLFLVMKLMRGGSLATRLQSGPLPWKQTVAWTGAIAEGLDYAHQKGLVHRDIKPDNILFDEQGQPVIADFGIVKALENSTANLSVSGGILGTPAYISPEIWNGMPASPATDVYALTCLVYEMSTGRKLFEAPTPPAVMALHFRPIEFSTPWPTDVPDQVGMVLQKGLALKPEDRFHSPIALTIALERLATNYPDRFSSSLPSVKSKEVPRTNVGPEAPQQLQKVPYGKYALYAGGGLGILLVFMLIVVLFAAAVRSDNKENDEVTQVPIALLPGDETGTITETPTRAPIDPADAAYEVTVVTAAAGARWQDGSAPLSQQIMTIVGDQSTLITGGDGSMELLLPGDGHLFIGVDTNITFQTPKDEALILEIGQGALVIQTNGQPVKIQNEFNVWGQIQMGLVGVMNTQNPFRFEVACFQGPCVLHGDLGGELVLESGQAGFVGGNGLPALAPDGIKNELYLFAKVVPTPTATATPTFTPTATNTATPTNTRPRPTNTPTPTPPPTLSPTDTPQPSGGGGGGNGGGNVTNTPEPPPSR